MIIPESGVKAALKNRWIWTSWPEWNEIVFNNFRNVSFLFAENFILRRIIVCINIRSPNGIRISADSFVPIKINICSEIFPTVASEALNSRECKKCLKLDFFSVILFAWAFELWSIFQFFVYSSYFEHIHSFSSQTQWLQFDRTVFIWNSRLGSDRHIENLYKQITNNDTRNFNRQNKSIRLHKQNDIIESGTFRLKKTHRSQAQNENSMHTYLVVSQHHSEHSTQYKLIIIKLK